MTYADISLGIVTTSTKPTLAQSLYQPTAKPSEAQANAFKTCLNTKGKYEPVPLGPVGPLTCGAAAVAEAAGCPYVSEIRKYCVSNKVGGVAPKVKPLNLWQTVTDAITGGRDAITDYTQHLATGASRATLPWLTYNALTADLQKEINQAGAAGIAKGLFDAYCRLDKIDGKLGPNTCYAAKQVGIEVPACRSYASSCGGTVVRKSGTSTPASAPPTSTSAPPVSTPPVSTPPVSTPPVSTPPDLMQKRSWLDQLRAMSPMHWAIALGAGAAVGVGIGYAIHANNKGARK